MEPRNSPRELIYLGSTKKDADKLPEEVQETFCLCFEIGINR